MNSTGVTNASVNEEVFFPNAYAEVYPEIRGLAADKVRVVNLDVASIVATVLGTLPEIVALRAKAAKELPMFDISVVDKLETRTMALGHAHALCATSTESPDGLPALSEEAAQLRDRYRSDANALVAHGLISADSLKDCKWFTGYKNIASDLHYLTTALTAAWSKIEDKCPINQEDLTYATRLAARILRMVGLREQAPALIAAAADNRARAFTLVVDSYDEVRRAVTYLRWWEGDADKIAPSLYAGRGHKTASDASESDAQAAATATVPAVQKSVNAVSSPDDSPFEQ